MTERTGTVTPEYILSLAWIDELRMLVNKHSHLGIIPDLAHMSTVELWGVYRYLLHMEE